MKLLPLQDEREDVHEELPEVVHSSVVIGEEGGDEVIGVVARGEEQDLGDDGGDRACWQATTSHRQPYPT